MKENLTYKISWITSMLNLLEDSKRDYREANERYGELITQMGQDQAERHIDLLKAEVKKYEDRLDKAVNPN